MEKERGGGEVEPVLCIKKCGFFGSGETMNMCSKCYREHVAAVEKELAKANANANNTGISAGAAEASTAPAVVVEEEKKRCFSCRKRVGLTGFKCRCGQTFCSLHRLSEEHDCSFDYKTVGRHAIAKENPLIKPTKIDKI